MGGTIEPQFMSPYDQRLFDQKAIDVALKNAMSHLMFIRLQSIGDQIVLKASNKVEKRHSIKPNGYNQWRWREDHAVGRC